MLQGSPPQYMGRKRHAKTKGRHPGGLRVRGLRGDHLELTNFNKKHSGDLAK